MSAASKSSSSKLGADQRLILILISVMLVFIIGISVLAPKQSEDDPTPLSTNNGPLGVKAAYLILEGLGHKTSRWSKSLAELNQQIRDSDAEKTTLVLLEPVFDATQEADLKAQLAQFMSRGGHVLTSGSSGARLLGGSVDQSMLDEGICATKPEGDSSLARAGSVEMVNHGGWRMDDPQFHGDNLITPQHCGKTAAVIQFTMPGTAGRGGAVWWTSATPMSTVELKQDAALRLMLASVGDQRDVIFEDSLHKLDRTLWDAAKGLPLGWLEFQAAALFVLLIFSFSRRRGPIRMPLQIPRTSPVEFATSMGDLYEKGRAISAVIEAAKRRLYRMLSNELGIATDTVKGGPDAIAEAVQKRLGSGSAELARRLAGHLREANEISDATVSQKSVLNLVQALSDDMTGLRSLLSPSTPVAQGRKSTVEQELEVAGLKETR